jgi:release factor glutamine methyltransferase
MNITMTEPSLKLSTPSTSHITTQPVYPPSEDSYLLLDVFCLKAEQQFLARRFPTTSITPLLVEIGTGSGVVTAFLVANALSVFSRKDIVALGLDVSFTANCVTNTTVDVAITENEVTAGFFCGSISSDLTSALIPNSVDILVFNPPYVPTEEPPSLGKLRDQQNEQMLKDQGAGAILEMEEYLLSLTYAGGKQGMETTDRLIAGLSQTLTDRGVCYLLLCAGNKPEEVIARIASLGWTTHKAIERRAGWEILSIWRIHRP